MKSVFDEFCEDIGGEQNLSDNERYLFEQLCKVIEARLNAQQKSISEVSNISAHGLRVGGSLI